MKAEEQTRAKARTDGRAMGREKPAAESGAKLRFETFRDMPVWQDAMEVAEQVHALTERLPRKEDYGFTFQVRRAALSIPANIAEAFGRNHTLDKVNFYYFARGSATETQSHLEYGKRVAYLQPESADRLSDRLTTVYNDLNKLIVALRRTPR